MWDELKSSELNDMMTITIWLKTEDEKLALIEHLRLKARKFGIYTRELVRRNPRMRSVYTYRERAIWDILLPLCISQIASHDYLKKIEAEGELERKDIDAVMNSLDGIKRIEDWLFDKADSSSCLTNEEKSRALLLMTAFPALCELKEPSKILEFLLELSRELDNLPELICEACEGQPLALLLVGSLLSFKPRAYDTWNRVKDDLIEIKESDHSNDSHNGATIDHMGHIYTYCYEDLPFLLQDCFSILASYPTDYEIPVRSLTEIWMAAVSLKPEEAETREENAYKYLEQLVQRSLVCVSKRSFLGTIKYCQVHQSIHEFCIQQSQKWFGLVVNPDKEQMRSRRHIAIHHDGKNEYREVNSDKLDSFCAFDFARIVLRSALSNLSVLELRKCAILEGILPKMPRLKYLGLRGSNISELPEDIGEMSFLETLDVRNTIIETLPQSLWNISKLRHVYVNPNPQIKGPPYDANMSDPQILKTVVIPESWLENFPHFLINLRKLGLLNRDNLDWKFVSMLLSQMVNLLSMTIIGDILPSEYVDTRAFPNLETVKSIKFEGKWNCRNLLIDNVKFPSNLTKLTLTKSSLKEDPMPRLEKIETLKFLSLNDGVYIGKKMICSANGFPQLQFLELSKLKNLEILEVKPMGMPQLSTLHVVQCPKLNNLHDLEHVTNRVIDN